MPELVFQDLCALRRVIKASDSLHTAVLYTTGILLVPVDSPDLTLLTGTATQCPSDNQVRENLIHNLPSMTSVSDEDSKDSPSGEPDILDQLNSEHRGRQNISMYTADLSKLLLLCGDIESNPGPTDRDEDPVTENQQTDEVSTEICICQHYMWSYHFIGCSLLHLHTNYLLTVIKY